MAIRTELVEVEGIFKEVGIDIVDIENEVFSFDNKIKSINSSNVRSISRLQDCILHLRNAKNRLRNLLQPSENKYIDSSLLNKMDEDIGRLDEDIDKKEKAIIEKSDTLDFNKISEERNIKINPLKNRLNEAMESLIIQACSSSAKKWDSYDEKNGIKIIDGEENKKRIARKDRHLYMFFLFQEMQPAAQSVGGFTRQKMEAFPKNITLHNPNPNSNVKQKQELGSKSEANKTEKDEEAEDVLFEEGEEINELMD